VPPPVSSELQAQRQRARAAIAAAVGPVDVRRIVWAPNASTGPTRLSPLSLYPYSVVARIARNDASVSHVVTRARLRGGPRAEAGGSLRATPTAAYLQNPFMLHMPDVGGFGQSAFVAQVLVQICIIMIIWHWL